MSEDTATATSRRPRSRWKTLRDHIVSSVALGVSGLVPRFPLRFVQGMGSVAGAIAWILPGKRARRVEQNLSIAFPMESRATRRSLARSAYISSAQTFLESVWTPAWTEADDLRVDVESMENIEKIKALMLEKKRGLVVFSAHLGTPELPAACVGRLFGAPMLAVASHPKNPGVERAIRRAREASGMRVVYRGEAGTAAMRHVIGGGILFMLSDHNLSGKGVAVPFFGKPAHTLLAPARLALQSGGVMAMVFPLRGPKGRIHLVIDGPIIFPPPERDRERRFQQECDLTVEYTKRIEAAIRRCPNQYLWMHDRWQKRSHTLPLPT